MADIKKTSFKIVDIADEIFRELGEPSTISIPAIAFWLRTNITSLNSLLNISLTINGITLEFDQPDEASLAPYNESTAILKKMYHVHYYDQLIRTNVGAASTDAVVEVASDGQRVRKINKSEIIRHLSSIKREEANELHILINAFKTNQSIPRQVAGDDTVEGSYNPYGREFNRLV